MAPELLATGSNYWIDSWDNLVSSSDLSVESEKTIGQILARVHEIPTEWFDEAKAQYIEEEPAAVTFPAGSLAWLHIHRELFKAVPAESDESKYEYATAVTTDHPIGGRIVTTHGLFYSGHIINLGEEHGEDWFRCINFANTCVTHAIHDIAYGICNMSLDQIKAFLSGYLEETTGQEASEEEIRSLWLEAELYKLTLWHNGGVLDLGSIEHETEEEVMKLIAAIQNFMEFVRNSEEAQNELLENGL